MCRSHLPRYQWNVVEFWVLTQTPESVCQGINCDVTGVKGHCPFVPWCSGGVQHCPEVGDSKQPGAVIFGPCSDNAASFEITPGTSLRNNLQ